MHVLKHLLVLTSSDPEALGGWYNIYVMQVAATLYFLKMRLQSKNSWSCNIDERVLD